MADHIDALAKDMMNPAARQELKKSYGKIGNWIIEVEDALDRAKSKKDGPAVEKYNLWLGIFTDLEHDIESHEEPDRIAKQLRRME